MARVDERLAWKERDALNRYRVELQRDRESAVDAEIVRCLGEGTIWRYGSQALTTRVVAANPTWSRAEVQARIRQLRSVGRIVADGREVHRHKGGSGLRFRLADVAHHPQPSRARARTVVRRDEGRPVFGGQVTAL